MTRKPAPKLNILTFAQAEETYLGVGERCEDDVDWNDPFLDAAVGPMIVGGIYVFAARTGTGKTYTALRQLMLCQQPGLYISLEDPLRELGRRVTAAQGFGQRAKERVKLYIPERPRLGLITQAMRESRARVVCVDYLQVIQDDSAIGTFDRMGQIRNILAELLGALKENQQSLLLMAQLRRPASGDDSDGPDGEKEKRGKIYHIRDSSDVENSATAVMLLHSLTRKKFDMTVGKAKGKIGGDRCVFERGVGGWPIPVKMTLSEAANTEETPADEPDPF